MALSQSPQPPAAPAAKYQPAGPPAGGGPGREQQHAPERADLHQPEVVRDARKKRRREREEGGQADCEERRAEAPETRGHEDRPRGQEQHVQERVGVKDGPLQAPSERLPG
jgi:hypothetical protein